MAAVSQKEKDMIERRNREWDQAQRRKKQKSKAATSAPTQALARRPAALVARQAENELEICERGIEAGLNNIASSRHAIGKYVKRVLDEELWKKGDYSGFENWCDERWGWTRQRGYQIAEGTAIIELLPAELSTVVDNERQARALVPVKESARPAVIKRALKSGEPITAKRITEAIKPRERKKKPKPVVIDVQPEPSQPKPRVHDCPMCRCES